MDREKTEEREAAAALADALGNLPLALEQAAAYATQAGISLADYLELFRSRRPEVEARLTGAEEYPPALATTFDISFTRLQTETPAAAELLTLCSFLAPDEFPLEFLKDGLEHLPPALTAAAADPEALAALVTPLQRYSLAKVRGGSFITFHHFVQAAARDRLSEEDRKNWAGTAVRLLKAIFPFEGNNPQTWEGSAHLLQHALAAAEQSRATRGAEESTGLLFNSIGLYLHNQVDLLKSKAAYEQALEITKAVFGLEHPNTSACLGNLGSVLQDLGRFDEARKSYELTLSIDEIVYGPDHPDVAIDLNNLGDLLHSLGDFEGARTLFERALIIDEKAYGPDHPEVAVDLSNLGLCLYDLEDFDGARANYERALRIDEKVFGPDHPKVSIRLNNLSSILLDSGDIEESRALLERSLAIEEKVYGPDHPRVAIRISNLSAILIKQGDFVQASANYKRALAIDERVYGSNHLEVATDLNNIGTVLAAQGDINGARANFERALRIRREVLGETHPSTVLLKEDLERLGEQ